MSPTERERALKKLAEVDAELNQLGPVPPAPTGMAAAGPTGQPEDVLRKTVPVVPSGKSTTQKVVEAGAPIVTTMYGAAKGAEYAAPIAARVPTPMGKAVVIGAGAVAGAATAGLGTELTIQGVQATMDLPGAPDSIDDAYQRAVSETFGQGEAELVGRTILGPITSRLAPFRRAMNPESAVLMKTMANRVRSAYEEIGGKTMVEDTRRWWNPGRIAAPLETELRDDAVYARLRDAGLDPEAARRVAITGGAQPSRLDTSITSKFWDRVSGSKMVPDEAYEQARGKLLHFATLNDLGTSFADQLPPERMGRTVIAALNGRFDTLNAVRQTAMNTLEDKLPTGLKLDISDLRKSMGATASVKGPSGMTIAGVPTGPATKQPGAKQILALPDNATFDQVQKVRAALGNMARDTRNYDPAARAELKLRIQELDNATRDALPVRLRSTFRKWTSADDDVNKAGFDSHFVAGMLRKEENALLYANKIIDNKDAENFGKLEAALKGTPDGARIIGTVRGAIAERFFAGSVNKHGILEPSYLHTALGTSTKGYGKYFLEATLGPQYVKTLNQYIQAMQTVDKAIAKAGSTVRVGMTLAGAVTGVAGLMRSAPGITTGSMTPTIVAAIFSPAVVSKVLSNPMASKLLVKTAENVAAGRNPMQTARLATRVLDAAGMTPEAALSYAIGGKALTPRQKAAEMVQQGMVSGGQPPALTGGAPLPGT
jgi:hypothetical protein